MHAYMDTCSCTYSGTHVNMRKVTHKHMNTCTQLPRKRGAPVPVHHGGVRADGGVLQPHGHPRPHFQVGHRHEGNFLFFLFLTPFVRCRKFLSLLFSIWYFQNPFSTVHWIGTSLVFGGIILFSDIPALLRKKTKTD